MGGVRFRSDLGLAMGLGFPSGVGVSVEVGLGVKGAGTTVAVGEVSRSSDVW